MKLKSYRKKKYFVLSTILLLLFILVGLSANKLYLTKYNGKIDAKVKVTNKVALKNRNDGSIVNKEEVKSINGNSSVNYDIKYKLETSDGNKINGKTAIIDINLSEADLNYASFNLINENNITSKIINDGKTLEITATNITTNKDYELTIKINLLNAPNNFKLSPQIEVREKTSEPKKVYANSLDVKTNSLTGTAVDSETKEGLDSVPITICKIEEVGCVDEKITYTNDNGDYSFSDLEIGNYEVNSGEDDETGKTEIEIEDGDNNLNINIASKNLFNATINKYVKSVEVVENNNSKSYEYNKLNKVALSVKNMDNAYLRVIYEFDISNKSSKNGFVKVITEDIPNGMELDKEYEQNKNWREIDGKLYNKTLANHELKVGETKTLTIALKTKKTTLAKNYVNNVSINGEVYHTVNFIYEDETIYQEVVLDTDLVTKQKLPTKENYNVKGWFTDKEGKNKFNFNTPITNDINLYAINRADSVNVTLTNRLVPYEIVEKIEYGKALDEPKRNNNVNGYTFKCWQKMDESNKTGVFEEESFDSNKCYNFKTPVEEDIHLIAVYTINSYKIRFLNKNSAGEYVDYSTEKMTSPFETDYGTKLTIPEPEPKQDLSEFIGWFESEDEGETFNTSSYNFSNIVDRDITLYSVFDKGYKYYSVTFVVQNDSSVVRVKANETVDKPTDPQINGYKFEGWYETDTFSTDEFNFDTPITKNITLYAKLEESDNNVIFKEPYDTPKTDNETDEENFEITKTFEVSYGDTIEKPLEPKKECKEFLGWFEKDEDGNFKKEPFSFDTKITKETILYALYKTSQVTVSFIDANGELIGEEQVIACGSKPKEPTPDDIPDEPGKEFVCWEIYGQDKCSDTPPGDNPHTTSIVYQTGYEQIAKLDITHVPTNWTNRFDTVTITMPDVKKITDVKTTETTLEDGTVIINKIEEEKEVEFTNKDDYEIEYKIEDGTYQKYDGPFEIDRNSLIYGRLKKKATGETGEDTEHLIDNIDKIAPRIDRYEAPGEKIFHDRFTIELDTTDLNDIERVSGIANIKLYISSQEEPFYNQDFEGNVTESISTVLSGLIEETTYSLKLEITDVAGNVTVDDSLEVTTNPGPHDVIARIISYNGVDLDPENYIEFYSLDAAINGRKNANGEIVQPGCSSTYGPVCTIQMVKSTNENILIPADLDIILDLNGTTVSNNPEIVDNLATYHPNLTTATFINNGSSFTVVDNNEDDMTIGTIQNINENGVAIYNTNSENTSLTVGLDEGKVEGVESVVKKTEPLIAGTVYGVYNNEKSKMNFYDGIIESTTIHENAASIYGDVTDTPYLYNVTPVADLDLPENIIASTLNKVSDAVARIGSVYYTYLNGDHPNTAIDAARTSFEEVRTDHSIISNYTNVGDYGFEYNEENGSLTSNNANINSSVAETVVKIETSSDSPANSEYKLEFNARVSSEENGDIACAIMSYNMNPIGSCNGSSNIINISGDNEQKVSTIINGSDDNYLHLIYSKNSSTNSGNDNFVVDQMTMTPVERQVIGNSEIVNTGNYGFEFKDGNIVNNNQFVDGSTASSYLKLDLTKYEGRKKIYIKAAINSEKDSDIGYLAITDSPNLPDYNKENFVELSGVKEYEDEVEVDGGKIYYLHMIYEKDIREFSGTDTFTISEVFINTFNRSQSIDVLNNLQIKKNDSNYYFETDYYANSGERFLQNNNGTYDGTIAHSYYQIDVSNMKTAKLTIEVYNSGDVTASANLTSTTSPLNVDEPEGQVFYSNSYGTKEFNYEFAGGVYYLHLQAYVSSYREHVNIESITIQDTSVTKEGDFLSDFVYEETGEAKDKYTEISTGILNEEKIDTIHLLKNVTTDAVLEIPATKAVVLDLNGYNLNNSINAPLVVNNGVFDLVDEKYDPEDPSSVKGSLNNLSNTTIENKEGATLNIHSVTINGEETVAAINNFGKLNYFEGSNINGINSDCIINNSSGLIEESAGILSSTGTGHSAINDKSTVQSKYENLNIEEAYYGITLSNKENSTIIRNANINNTSYGISNARNIEIQNSEIGSSLSALYNNSGSVLIKESSYLNGNESGIESHGGKITLENAEVISNNLGINNNSGGSEVQIGIKNGDNLDVTVTANRVFSNSGTLNFYSGTLNSNIQSENSNVFNMTGGKLISKSSGIHSTPSNDVEGSKFHISGGSIDFCTEYTSCIGLDIGSGLLDNDFILESKGDNSTGVQNFGNTKIIDNVQIIGKNFIGIRNVNVYGYGTPTLTLGKKDDKVDINYPKIYSKSVAIVNPKINDFNFYDGVLTGRVGNTITRAVSDFPETYDLNIKTNNEDANLEDITLAVPTEGIAIVETDDGNGNITESEPYATIQDAINAAPDEGGKVKLISNKMIRTILSNQNSKDITFDTNGVRLITYSKQSLFRNTNNLKLTDSTSVKTDDTFVCGSGLIISNASEVILNSNNSLLQNICTETYSDSYNNMGTLQIESSNLTTHYDSLIPSNLKRLYSSKIVNNSGTLDVNSGVLKSEKDYVVFSNSGTININGGNLTSNDGNTVGGQSKSAININDGKIYANGSSTTAIALYDDSNLNIASGYINGPSGITYDDLSEGTISITGGTIEVNNTGIASLYSSKAKNIIIKNATINSSNYGITVKSDDLLIEDSNIIGTKYKAIDLTQTNSVISKTNIEGKTGIYNVGSTLSLSDCIIKSKSIGINVKGVINSTNNNITSDETGVLVEANYIISNNDVINAIKTGLNVAYSASWDDETHTVVKGSQITSDIAIKNETIIDITNDSILNGNISNLRDHYGIRVNHLVKMNVISASIKGNIDNYGTFTLGVKGDNEGIPSIEKPEIIGIYNGRTIEGKDSHLNFYDGIVKNEKVDQIDKTEDEIIKELIGSILPNDIETKYSVIGNADVNYYYVILDIMPVARIVESNGVSTNLNIYDDLSLAFSNELCNSSCKIELLQSVNQKDTITINENQNIEFNLKKQEITTDSGVDPKFINNGTLKITSDVMENSDKDATPLGTLKVKILNNNNLTLKDINIRAKMDILKDNNGDDVYLPSSQHGLINAGTLNFDSQLAFVSYLENSGEVNILNIPDRYEDQSNVLYFKNSGTVNMNSGIISSLENDVTANIKGGKITLIRNSKDLNVTKGTIGKIYNGELAEVNLGTNDDTISKTSPEINKIENARYGNINYYDGTINSVRGKISQIPNDYYIDTIVNSSSEKSLVLDTTKNIEVGSNTYHTLNEALNDSSCLGISCKIKLLNDIYIVSTEESSIIERDKDITIDLNGFKIQSGIKTTFKNYGNLTIKDESSSAKGTVYTSDGIILYNEGIVNTDKITLKSDRNDAVIVNIGNSKVALNDTTVEGSIGAIVNLQSSNSLDYPFDINNSTFNISSKKLEVSELNNSNKVVPTDNGLRIHVDPLIENNIEPQTILDISSKNAAIYNISKKVNYNSGVINIDDAFGVSAIYNKSGNLELKSEINVTTESDKLIVINSEFGNINFEAGTINLNKRNRSVSDYYKHNFEYNFVGIQSTNGITNVKNSNINIDRGITYGNIYSDYISYVYGIKSVGELNVEGANFNIKSGSYNVNGYNMSHSSHNMHEVSYTPYSISIDQNINKGTIKGNISEVGSMDNYSKSISLNYGANLLVQDGNISDKIFAGSTSTIDVINSTINNIDASQSTVNISSNSVVNSINSQNLKVDNSNISGTIYSNDITITNNSTSNVVNSRNSLNMADSSANSITAGGTSADLTNVNLNGTLKNSSTQMNIKSSTLKAIEASNGLITFNSGSSENITTSESGNIDILDDVTSVGNINHSSYGTINIGATTTGGIINSGVGVVNISGNAVVNSEGIGIETTNENAVVNIGTNDDSLSTTNPSITGGEYGTSNVNGTINFYDGIIKGGNGTAIYGNISYDNVKYGIKLTDNDDGSQSAILTEIGEIDVPIYANGQGYTNLQHAVNASHGTEDSPTIITLSKDITLLNDIVIAPGKYVSIYLCGHTINYGEFTISGEGSYNIYDGNPSDNSTLNTSSIGATIRSLLNIDTPIQVKRNIVIFNTDEGEKLEAGYTYELRLLSNDGNYEKVDVDEDINNVGRYTISTKSSDAVMTPINGRIYINNLPNGNYKVISNNNKEITFSVSDDGKLIGNAKENNTSNFTNTMSSSKAEVILGIQTGITVFKFGLLATLITIILGLLIIAKNQTILNKQYEHLNKNKF